MKNILTLILILFSLLATGQEQFICGVPDRAITPPTSELIAKTPDGLLCSKIYVQVDADIVADKGRSGAENWTRNLMAEVGIPYADIDIELSYVFEFLETEVYTDGSSYEMLQQFRQRADQFDADVAILLSYKSSGGVAWVDQACLTSGGYKYGFANVRPSYLPFRQGYSWNVEVVSHELGHLYGSPHLQDCAWVVDGVGGQALEGCYQGNGNCNDGPIPTDGGQIMGYCHIRAGVGINFAHGFHEQVVAIMRTTVYNRCETCDNPGGGGDPPSVECEDNPLFINLILDDYPDETRYAVVDLFGDTIHQNGPFSRYASNGSRMTGEVITDTLCLPDGCYLFVIIDENGLGTDDCNEGLYYVGDPFGEITSGQRFTTKETTRFCLGVTPPDGDCQDVVLRADSLIDYANQSRSPWAIVTDIEGGVTVEGNNWRALPYTYNITPNTVLTFEALIETVGEIQGVALLDNIRSIYPDRSFRFGGTQNWGIAIEQIIIGEWVNVTIQIGQYFTGEVTHVVLINDDDHRAVVKTGWRNMEICESGQAGLKMGFAEPQGAAKDEAWSDNRTIEGYDIARRAKERRPHPNPTTDTLILPLETMWHLYGVNGRLIDEGWGSKVDLSLLPTGFYLLHDGTTTHKVVKK